jgi:sec-independent protein translocase protein TatC
MADGALNGLLGRGGSAEEDTGEGRMPFLAHLGELRHRILVSLIAVGVGFVLAFNFSEPIITWLARPLRSAQRTQSTDPSRRLPSAAEVDARVDALFPGQSYTGEQRQFLKNLTRAVAEIDQERGQRLQVIEVTESFWVNMKVALIAGLFLVLPVVLYEVWAFIAPGLLPHERRFAIPFVVISTGLFALGATFALAVVIPFAVQFLASYKTGNMLVQFTLTRYVDFVLKFTLAFGLVFELPLAMTLAARLGLVTPAFLSQNRKYAILINFVIAAVLTPTPDAFNQLLMAAPLCLLYEAGIVAARVFGRRAAKAA